MQYVLSVGMLTSIMLFSLNAVGFGQEAAEKKEEKAPDTPAQQPKKDENTPEGALTKFLIAMTAHDKDGLKSVAIPHDELDLLFVGEKPTASTLAGFHFALALSPMKRLKVGDEIKLPGGRSLVMDKTRVNETRQALTAIGAPIPFDVLMIDGKWKVDAGPVIAARKAAKKAIENNKKREAEKAEAGK